MEKDIRSLKDAVELEPSKEEAPTPSEPVPLKKTGMKKASNDS
jgi:hypothetical protein